MTHKLLLVLLVSVALVTAGCEAFNDYYGEPEEEIDEPLGSEGEGVPVGDQKIIDYSVDQTPCEHISGISVAMGSEAELAENAGWTTEVEDDESVSITAEKIGQYTTAITITKDGEESPELTFTIKQVADDGFAVCDVMYSACVGNCFGVKSMWSEIDLGSLVIDRLSYESTEDSVINAGYYRFSFEASNMGEPTVELEGTYFSNLLGEPVAVE